MGETNVGICLYNNGLNALKGMNLYEFKLWITVGPKYKITYLEWSNRHVVRTCAVSSQWPLSVYEVLVA